jgi:integral membrane protein (TIGR01906 family)
MNNFELLKKIGKWLIAILIPFFILFTVARILISPLFLQLEYRMPRFPDDTYGFTLEDRLEYAPFAVKYILNSEGIDYLGDLKFDNGNDLYSERELSHMVDVKDLVVIGKGIWIGMVLVFIIFGLLSWKNNLIDWFKDSVSFGGLLTVSALALISLIGLLSFDAIFTTFHQIFFEDGTWTFYYSDTLIRLFPVRFWQDVIVFELVLSIGTGLGLWLGLRKKGLPDG